MGIRPWYDVFCDHDGCVYWTTGGATKREAAAMAIRAGWRAERGRGWRCTEHQNAQYGTTALEAREQKP